MKASLFKEKLNSRYTMKGCGVGSRRADFVVANKVVVELKAVIKLEDVHLAQARNYLVETILK